MLSIAASYPSAVVTAERNYRSDFGGYFKELIENERNSISTTSSFVEKWGRAKWFVRQRHV